MQLKITHTTTYHYDQPVDYALQKVRLRPQRINVQDIIDWDIAITGGQIEAQYTDHYGNHVDLVNADVGVMALKIAASGTVETKGASGVLGQVYGRAPLWHFLQSTEATAAGQGVLALAEGTAKATDRIAALHDLSARILAAVPYKVGETHSQTLAEEALDVGAGVCQDHAQIFIAAVRAEGIPARYVSGYLMINDQVAQDATHAWAEAHVDGLGWVGFDVSNGVSPDEKYVRIAVGRDARDAAPMQGLRLGTAEEQMIVSLQVQQ